MKLEKNSNKSILDDSLGQFINAWVELVESGNRWALMYIQPTEFEKMEKENPNKEGMPQYFTFKIGGKQTEFYFYPKADKNYEIGVLYYPQPKIG